MRAKAKGILGVGAGGGHGEERPGAPLAAVSRLDQVRSRLDQVSARLDHIIQQYRRARGGGGR